MFCHIDTIAPCVYQAHSMASPCLCTYICVSASSIVRGICIERLEAYALSDVINGTNLPAVTREPKQQQRNNICRQNEKKKHFRKQIPAIHQST